jgi:hypothetical protein
MPSARYAPLPNSRPNTTVNREMEDAFEDDDDEDGDDLHDVSESHPLQQHRSPSPPTHTRAPSTPATYDFENFDYANIIPAGEPPGPSTSAFPNSFGNSNGYVPETHDLDASELGPRRGWLTRAAASVLPASAVRKWGLDYERPVGSIGGGTGNDGVFANVTAKPGRNVEIREGAPLLSRLRRIARAHVGALRYRQATTSTSCRKRPRRKCRRHTRPRSWTQYRLTGKQLCTRRRHPMLSAR